VTEGVGLGFKPHYHKTPVLGLCCSQNRLTWATDSYIVLLLQVASEMGLMTLAWPVGKNFFQLELINHL
jgi:hypothetical protein